MNSLQIATGVLVLLVVLALAFDFMNGLHDAANWSRGPAVDTLARLTERFHDYGASAPVMAIKEMSLMVRQQATVMSFADVFLMLTLLFIVLAALGIVMKRPAPAAAAGAEGH